MPIFFNFTIFLFCANENMYQLRYSNFDSYFNSFISQMYLLIWLSFDMLSLNIMKSHIKYTKNLENIDFGPYITVNLC